MRRLRGGLRGLVGWGGSMVCLGGVFGGGLRERVGLGMRMGIGLVRLDGGKWFVGCWNRFFLLMVVLTVDGRIGEEL